MEEAPLATFQDLPAEVRPSHLLINSLPLTPTNLSPSPLTANPSHPPPFPLLSSSHPHSPLPLPLLLRLTTPPRKLPPSPTRAQDPLPRCQVPLVHALGPAYPRRTRSGAGEEVEVSSVTEEGCQRLGEREEGRRRSQHGAYHLPPYDLQSLP
jgi:hypothetical protein